MSKTLYGSAGSLDGIRKLIAEFYGGSTITLAEVKTNLWTVATGKGLCDGMQVRKLRNRYRFESTNLTNVKI